MRFYLFAPKKFVSDSVQLWTAKWRKTRKIREIKIHKTENKMGENESNTYFSILNHLFQDIFLFTIYFYY